MTIYDISEKAGVSIATVSRVLNGSNNVSEKTKKKVLDVINQYEYTPNAFARGLGLNTMKTIGIMCADSSDPYLAKAIYYIEQKLRANGYDSILCCTGYDLDTKSSSMNLLITKKVDGIILVGSNFIYEKEDDNKYILGAAALGACDAVECSHGRSQCLQHRIGLILLPCMMPPWNDPFRSGRHPVLLQLHFLQW